MADNFLKLELHGQCILFNLNEFKFNIAFEIKIQITLLSFLLVTILFYDVILSVV